MAMKGLVMIKTGAAVLAMAFCIFFGVTLATQGIERVNGPLAKSKTEHVQPQERAYSAAPAGKAAASAPAPQSQPKPKQVPVEPTADTGINRVGNKAGDLLQIMAYHCIRWFVTLFEAIFG